MYQRCINYLRNDITTSTQIGSNYILLTWRAWPCLKILINKITKIRDCKSFFTFQSLSVILFATLIALKTYDRIMNKVVLYEKYNHSLKSYNHIIHHDILLSFFVNSNVNLYCKKANMIFVFSYIGAINTFERGKVEMLQLCSIEMK